MLIEYKYKNLIGILNTDNLSLIKYHFDSILKVFLVNGDLTFDFDEKEEATAFYKGFILALNGLDFICGDNYLKPLLTNKNETLYKYMLLKEVLNNSN